MFGIEVTYAVKDRPILNDATIEDAVHVGMTEQIRVISNGSGFLGTVLKTVQKNSSRPMKKRIL